MTNTLSNTGDESSDVEIVYEEVSLQSKLRQELHMLEILRDTQEPIPANYSAFKERVGRLKYSFCPEVVDDVWKKLEDTIALEKEGKLGCDFNKRSLCGRDNCVCGKVLPIVEVTSSESETDCQQRNYKTLHKSSILNGSTVGSSDQHEPTTESLNCSNKDTDKNDNDSEIYTKSCRECVTDCEEVHNKKSKRSRKGGVSESDCHIESHSERNKSKSKINSQFNEEIGSHCKRRYSDFENSYEYSSVETHTHEDITNTTSEFDLSKETLKSQKEQVKVKSTNNEIVNSMEVNTDSDILYSRKKKKKQKESVPENTDNEDNMYNTERERKTVKKEKHKNIDEVNNTDTFDCVSINTQEDADSTVRNDKKRKKHKIKNERTTSHFYNDVCEMDKMKSEFSSTSTESIKHKKNADDNSISDVDMNDDSKTYRKENDIGTNEYNKKHKNKLKKQAWSESLSDITKHVCDLVENEVKTEEDNSDKMSKKTGSRHKKQRSSTCINGYSKNGRERSVIIDAHIEIVRSSKNEGQRRTTTPTTTSESNNNDTESSKGDNSTSSRKKQKISDDKKYDSNSGISKSELKEFIKLQNKEKRKEKQKLVKHEWQLIHDRIVELLVPKYFSGKI